MSKLARPLSLAVIGLAAALSLTGPTKAQDDPPPPEAESAPEIAPEMAEALERMEEVIKALDEDAKRIGNAWEFSVDELVILAVTDPAAVRWRSITPIAEAASLPEGALERLMQANFDTALDARYAIANGLVWGTFIHPLDSLTTRDFASGILQTKSLADTFGTTFSSGALSYGGGDSGAIIEDQLKELLDELEKRKTV